MRTLRSLAMLVALGALYPLPAAADEPAATDDIVLGRETLELVVDPSRSSAAVHQAVKQYLAQIEEIDRKAAQAKAEATAKLLAALERRATEQRTTEQTQSAPKSVPGLIGAASIDGEPAGIAFHYEHGKLFPRELLWDRFHKPSAGGPQFSNVNITLLGHVEVPREMAVKVSQAAGGVNGDHGTLFVGDRQLGQVGDDTAKAEIYLLVLPEGVHPIRWVLTGGTFQNNLLRFEDPTTGQLLPVFYDAEQRRQSGAADARENVEASTDPGEWLKAVGSSQWRWVPLSNP